MIHTQKKGICGCGVAFKLCQALWQHFHPESALWTDLIELAAVATVADVVPLVGKKPGDCSQGTQEKSPIRLLWAARLDPVGDAEGSPITT